MQHLAETTLTDIAGSLTFGIDLIKAFLCSHKEKLPASCYGKKDQKKKLLLTFLHVRLVWLLMGLPKRQHDFVVLFNLISNINTRACHLLLNLYGGTNWINSSGASRHGSPRFASWEGQLKPPVQILFSPPSSTIYIGKFSIRN